MKKKFWAFAESVGLGVRDLSNGKYKEPIPYFSISNAIRLWMSHPILSKSCVETSNLKTLPHIRLLLQNPHYKIPLSPEITSTADGSEWLEPFRRTMSIWKPTFDQATLFGPKVIFLHILLFADGVPLFKKRQKGFEVLTSTLGEFDEGLRSSSKSPAILMNMMASKDILLNFFKSYDQFLTPIVAELQELINGKEFYCEELKEKVVVIAAFHGFEADFIGRCKAGGFKQPNQFSKAFCNACESWFCKIADDVADPEIIKPKIRDGRSLKEKLPLIKHQMDENLRVALLDQFGLSRISGFFLSFFLLSFFLSLFLPFVSSFSFLIFQIFLQVLWDIPGSDLTKQLLLELMHLEAEGEIIKHFWLFSSKISSINVNFPSPFLFRPSSFLIVMLSRVSFGRTCNKNQSLTSRKMDRILRMYRVGSGGDGFPSFPFLSFPFPSLPFLSIPFPFLPCNLFFPPSFLNQTEGI